MALSIPKNPAKLFASAVAIGTISSLDKIICSVGGGKIDTRSLCTKSLENLLQNCNFLPIDINIYISRQIKLLTPIFIHLEEILDLCENCQMTITTTRNVLSSCHVIEQCLVKKKKKIVSNIHLINSEVICIFQEEFKMLQEFIDSVPKFIDMSIKMQLNNFHK